MQQALEYAEILDIPFVYSSNGKGFLEHDRTGTATQMTTHLALDEFPSPQELWNRYRKYKGFTKEEEKIVTQDYFIDQSGKTPRYYQSIAIKRSVDAVAKVKERIL